MFFYATVKQWKLGSKQTCFIKADSHLQCFPVNFYLLKCIHFFRQCTFFYLKNSDVCGKG